MNRRSGMTLLELAMSSIVAVAVMGITYVAVFGINKAQRIEISVRNRRFVLQTALERLRLELRESDNALVQSFPIDDPSLAIGVKDDPGSPDVQTGLLLPLPVNDKGEYATAGLKADYTQVVLYAPYRNVLRGETQLKRYVLSPVRPPPAPALPPSVVAVDILPFKTSATKYSAVLTSDPAGPDPNNLDILTLSRTPVLGPDIVINRRLQGTAVLGDIVQFLAEKDKFLLRTPDHRLERTPEGALTGRVVDKDTFDDFARDRDKEVPDVNPFGIIRVGVDVEIDVDNNPKSPRRLFSEIVIHGRNGAVSASGSDFKLGVFKYVPPPPPPDPPPPAPPVVVVPPPVIPGVPTPPPPPPPVVVVEEPVVVPVVRTPPRIQ